MSELITYVRAKGKIRGVVVATGKTNIGWSQANEKAGDKFDKQVGISIARTRAIHGVPQKKSMPNGVAKVVNKMQLRAIRYFKD